MKHVLIAVKALEGLSDLHGRVTLDGRVLALVPDRALDHEWFLDVVEVRLVRDVPFANELAAVRLFFDIPDSETVMGFFRRGGHRGVS